MVTNSQLQELLEQDWTAALGREVQRIRLWRTVDAKGITVSTDSVGRLRIGFTVRTDRLLEPSPTEIQTLEPISLVYRSLDAVGQVAPFVWSDRLDFPRDIGHINPTPADQPASLCLARAGLQPVYDRFGVDGVVDRLVSWFHDAKTGQLMADGWEPVPMGDGQNRGAGFLEIGHFQEMAWRADEGNGPRYGVARRLGNLVEFLSSEVDPTNDTQVREARRRIRGQTADGGVVETYIPWTFVWSDSDEPVSRQLFGVWNTYGQIEAGLDGLGLKNVLRTAIMTAVQHLAGDAERPTTPIGLLLGVWRPLPISDSVLGMADSPDARRLEIRGYLLRCDKHRLPIDQNIETQQLFGFQRANQKMLALASGTDGEGSAALFGYGALGSTIGDFLLRAGVPRAVAFDADYLAPHNLARHSATADHQYRWKADHFQDLGNSLTFLKNDIISSSATDDVTSLSDGRLAEIVRDYPLIIDATASEHVRRHLATSRLPQTARLLRAEIFHRGRLGALFVAGPANNPNLIDLYYALCIASLDEKSVETWLREERAEGTSSDEMVLGMGCASPTTAMPKYMVAQHASAFMPRILAGIEGAVEPGIAINPTDATGAPLGTRWLPHVGPVTVLEPDEAADWQVRIAPSASCTLTEFRERSGDIETGGYLYGGFDFALKRIYVIAVSDLPPGSDQRANGITLGPAGRTRLERNISRRTAGKLTQVGTWHSHPRSGAKPSPKDRRTMRSFRKKDRSNGLPTLLVISSPEGLGANMWV